jgi:hypothetical protein
VYAGLAGFAKTITTNHGNMMTAAVQESGATAEIARIRYVSAKQF